MIELIKMQIANLEAEIEELEEIFGEGLCELDAMDASGGNFDDAYEMGSEHGEIYGKLSVLYDVLKMLEENYGQ